jgi:hypothetical protein
VLLFLILKTLKVHKIAISAALLSGVGVLWRWCVDIISPLG